MSTPRPTGISILAALHLIGAALGLIMFAWAARQMSNVEDLRDFGIAPATLAGGVALLWLLALASGIGMIRGAKWGWWLGAFFYMYSVFRNVNALVIVAQVLSDPVLTQDVSRGPEFYAFKHGSRIVLHAFIYAYFLRAHVLEYFGLGAQGLLRRVLMHAGAAVSLFVVGTVLNAFA